MSPRCPVQESCAALTRQLTPPRLLTNLPYSTADKAIMDSLIIGLAIAAALYIGVRLALRFYFPPDT
jgi:hypothetical protein